MFRSLRHRRNAVIAALVLLAVSVTGCSGAPPSPQATAPTPASTGSTTPSTGPTPRAAARQTVLPFTGLIGPQTGAVDSIGNLYVADWANKRVLKLAEG